MIGGLGKKHVSKKPSQLITKKQPTQIQGKLSQLVEKKGLSGAKRPI